LVNRNLRTSSRTGGSPEILADPEQRSDFTGTIASSLLQKALGQGRTTAAFQRSRLDDAAAQRRFKDRTGIASLITAGAARTTAAARGPRPASNALKEELGIDTSRNISQKNAIEIAKIRTREAGTQTRRRANELRAQANTEKTRENAQRENRLLTDQSNRLTSNLLSNLQAFGGELNPEARAGFEQLIRGTREQLSKTPVTADSVRQYTKDVRADSPHLNTEEVAEEAQRRMEEDGFDTAPQDQE
jgi:hypothetical protein